MTTVTIGPKRFECPSYADTEIGNWHIAGNAVAVPGTYNVTPWTVARKARHAVAVRWYNRLKWTPRFIRRVLRVPVSRPDPWGLIVHSNLVMDSPTGIGISVSR